MSRSIVCLLSFWTIANAYYLSARFTSGLATERDQPATRSPRVPRKTAETPHRKVPGLTPGVEEAPDRLALEAGLLTGLRLITQTYDLSEAFAADLGLTRDAAEQVSAHLKATAADVRLLDTENLKVRVMELGDKFMSGSASLNVTVDPQHLDGPLATLRANLATMLPAPKTSVVMIAFKETLSCQQAASFRTISVVEENSNRSIRIQAGPPADTAFFLPISSTASSRQTDRATVQSHYAPLVEALRKESK